MAHPSPDTAARPARGQGDRELLGRFVRAHDEAAFTALVERHGPMVLAVCRRALHNASDAEDACQATFLVLARKAPSVRKAESLAGWLHGIACRVCANLKRERRRRWRRERAALPTPPPEPPAEVSWREVRAALDEELLQLPDRLRAPLILCYLEGHTRDQAAQQLGLTPGCLHGRLERARRLLSGRLARRGFTLSAALLASAFGGAARAAPSPTLVLSSARAAALLARGRPVPTALVPGHVLSLTQKVLHGMFLTRLTLTLSALACAALLLAAVGGTLTSAGPAPDPKTPPPGDPRPALGKEPLPAGAVRRLGSRRFRIAGRCGFALSAPDGKHLLVQANPSLSSYASHGLVLLDADTGLRVRTFEDSRRVPKCGTMSEAIRPAAFSPDGKTLYGLGWHKAEEKREEVGNIIGRVWAGIDNPCQRVLLVWDVATGKRKAEHDLPPGEGLGSSLIGLTVSPDGKRLYVYGALRMEIGPDRRVLGVPGLHVLDAATGKKLQTWEGAGHPVGMIAGGKELITFRRGAPITAHDIESGKPVRTFPLAGLITSVVFSPDGKTVAAVAIGGDGDKRTCTVKLWDAATGRALHRLAADPRTISYFSPRLAFAADGKTLFLGASSGRILRWKLPDGRPLSDWPAHHGSIRELFPRPGKDELISVGASDDAVCRWDAATGRRLSATEAYTGEIALARAPGGKQVAIVDAAGRLELREVLTGRITRTLRTPGRGRHQLAFTPDGRQLLVAAEFGPSTVWDLSAGKQVGKLVPPSKKDPKVRDNYWGTLRFSPDGKLLLASKFYRGNWAWTWPERKVLWHEAGAFPVAPEWESSAFPDGERVAGGTWHGAIEIRDPRTGAVKRTLAGRGLTDVRYSPDRRRMVTTHLGGAWQVRDGGTGEVLKEVKPFQHAWCAAFSPTGWLLAVSGDNSVRVYDTASWDEVARLDGHDGTVRTVFFGPDDATLVSGSAEDGTALVWSLPPPGLGEAPDPAKLWADLAGKGQAVRQAVWAAARHPDEALALFRAKWPVPKTSPDPKRIRRLIAELDSPTFARREAAEAELAKLGRRAGPALRKALKSTTSAEVKRRARKLLAHWAPPLTAGYSAEAARELRAVWALELANTPEARKLLEAWVAAGVGDRLCEEAAAALERMGEKD
jgi:RNA polymerase sigma factor (sigma-70 family)